MSTVTDVHLGAQRLWWLLQELPSYAMVTVTLAGRTYELLARDLPKPGRRMTCTTTGTEWFIDTALFENIGHSITEYTITLGGKVR